MDRNNITRSELLSKKKELEETVNLANERLKAIDSVLHLMDEPQPPLTPFSGKRTNYDIVESIIKYRKGPIQLKDLFKMYTDSGGGASRASFDVVLGNWVKNPKKKISRVGMGLYQYSG